MSGFSHRWFQQINEIDQASWDALFGSNPFTAHAFLSALEQSHCVCQASGWQPCHLAVYEENHIVALAPGYIKTHSYGEYVFDWSWADAYARHGLAYYPKWLCGSPFSPIEGTRIAIRHAQPEAIYHYLSDILDAECRARGWSGWHINFCTSVEANALTRFNGLYRQGVQFQWFNHNYLQFEDFLIRLTARKRKDIKKERFKIQQQGIRIEWLQGEQITPARLRLFQHFYQQTYLKRSGHQGYLNADFFERLGSMMPQRMLLMFAEKEHRIIAATLSFVGDDTLYGRYWGALEEVPGLHFELCYYQGIDYCIQHKLACFHAGAQGEHKIPRGFEPVFTHSVHALMHAEFNQAIASYLQEERQHILAYHQQCQALLPFKQLPFKDQ
jgi:predicted N-acyltransferase